jgi:hypothetical protein
MNERASPVRGSRALAEELSAEREIPPAAIVGPGIDAAWANRVASRLRGEFGALVASFPHDAQRSTGMARWLSLQVPMCHRVISGIRAKGELSGVFDAFPGVEGLRSFLRASAMAKVSDVRLAQCSAAVDELQALVEHAGGSQRRLVAGLEAMESGLASLEVGESPSDQAAVQRRLFQGAAELLGCRSKASLAVRVYTPAKAPAFAGDLDVTATVGRAGFIRAGASTPFVLSYRTDDSLRDTQANAEPANMLLSEFCASPMPRVTCDFRFGVAIEIVDPSFECTTPIDIFAGPFESSNVLVRENEVNFLNSSIVVSHPSERLVSDVYVPRSMVGSLECCAGAYHHGSMGGLTGPPSRRWFDRLPVTVTPLLLGRGIGNARLQGFPKHVRLTERIFDAAGAVPSDYTGFRLEVAYPLLYAQYALSFEFGPRD